MSEGHDQARFAPRPRRQATNSHDRANLDAELELIRARIDTVTACGREDFHDGKETYDVACMVIIRLAALLERPEFEPHMETVTQQERLAIRTTHFCQGSVLNTGRVSRRVGACIASTGWS